MDNKEKWRRYLSSFKDDLMYAIKYPDSSKYVWWRMKFKDTIYESPKTFKNSFAFNDGTWLRFPKEYRAKNGNPKGIFLKTTKDVIKELAFFCRFQCLLGVSIKEELVYHMMCFLCNVVKVYDDAFAFNDTNRKVLFKIAENVLTSEVKQEVLEKLKDKRAFCISSDTLQRMNKNAKTSLQAKGRRMCNYISILKKYDEGKSISQNAIVCGTSTSTIKRFKRYKTDVEKYIKDNGIEIGR